jgi:hypothetical protein
MTRHNLLDMLGTEKLPKEAERRFVEYCIWQQSRPALVQIMKSVKLNTYAAELTRVNTLEALSECMNNAGMSALTTRDIPVMALAAVQGAVAEAEAMVKSASAQDADAAAISFHAARIVGWASWAINNFSTGMFKSSAEQVAYGEQLQQLMKMLGAASV